MEVPLRLVVKPSTPSKEADHKITIATNKNAVNLPELFPGIIMYKKISVKFRIGESYSKIKISQV